MKVLRAMEDQEEHPKAVKRGHEDTGHDGELCKAGSWQVRALDGVQDRVLGVKAGEERGADERQRARQRSQPGDAHVLPQAAHVADVLVVVHADDDRACTEEQQGLEEGVRHQVKDRDGIGRDPQRHRHVTQLRQGRVSHDALDVVLDDAQKAHEQGRDRANDDDEVQGHVRALKERRHARDHEDPRRDHGGGVDQRRDRRWAFHGVRQPHVQRKLRRLAHGTNEQTNTNHRHQWPIGARQSHLRQGVRLAKQLGIVE